MALNRLDSFGIHQITFRDLADKSILGTGHILGSAEIDSKRELIKLEGGSSPYPFAVAPSRATGEVTMTFRQYDKNILRFLSSYSASTFSETEAGEVAGSITSIVNETGTSVSDATTGIASVSINDITTAPFGNYIIKAASASTIDLYLDNNLSNGVSYQDAGLKINSSAITIPSTGATVDYQGLTFTGGSGTIAMTTNDIASFSVNPVSNYLLNVNHDKQDATFREFECFIYSQNVNNKIRRVHIKRAIASSSIVPSFLENEFASMECSLMILQPSDNSNPIQTTFFGK